MACSFCDINRAKIARLEEELAAWKRYRADSAIADDNGNRAARVVQAFGLTRGIAETLLMLYDASPRHLTPYFLWENRWTDHERVGDYDERNRTVAVLIHKLRRAIGRGGVITLQNLGYRLSDEATDRVREVLAR